MSIAETQLRMLHDNWPRARWNLTKLVNGDYEVRREVHWMKPPVVRTRGLTFQDAIDSAMWTAIRDGVPMGKLSLCVLDGAA